MDFKNIVNANSAKYKKWEINKHYSGKFVEVGRKLKSQKLGFHIQTLAPNKFSCPYHYHNAEEELFFVIEGEATMRQNNQYCKVGEGDLIYFGLGKEYAHQFYNHTDKPFKFLAISNKDKLDTAVYPDSDKIIIRKSRQLFKQSDAVSYLTDEENPKSYWDEKYL